MNRIKSRENKCFSERVRVENRITHQFDENWGWLVQEYDKNREELNQAFKLERAELPQPKANLKPFPATSAGMVGWLSTRPSCQLEIFGPDVPKLPPLPDIYVVTRLNDPLSDGLDFCD